VQRIDVVNLCNHVSFLIVICASHQHTNNITNRPFDVWLAHSEYMALNPTLRWAGLPSWLDCLKSNSHPPHLYPCTACTFTCASPPTMLPLFRLQGNRRCWSTTRTNNCVWGVVVGQSSLLWHLGAPLASSGELKVKGYSFLYSGHRDLVRKGVALVLSPSVVCNVLAWLVDCFMWARLQLEKGFELWVVVCYAPTYCNGDQPKDAFYEAFSSVVATILARDLVLCLGDFNAQVGSNVCEWEGVLGGFRLPSTARPPTNNGMWLLSFCLSHRLSTATSYFG
jgi:hypothetical protein